MLRNPDPEPFLLRRVVVNKKLVLRSSPSLESKKL